MAKTLDLLTAPAVATTAKAAKKDKKAREVLARTLFVSGVTFLNSLSPAAESVVAGETITISPNHTLDAANPASAACIICGGTHGVKSGRISNAANFAKTLVFARADKSTFLISNSGSEGCFETYVRPVLASVKIGRSDALNAIVGGSTEPKQKSGGSK